MLQEAFRNIAHILKAEWLGRFSLPLLPTFCLSDYLALMSQWIF